jgi:hypothetical protein
MARTMDAWGDWYEEPATQESLIACTALVRAARQREERQEALAAPARAHALTAAATACSALALCGGGGGVAGGSSAAGAVGGAGGAGSAGGARAEAMVAELLRQLPEADVTRLCRGASRCLMGLVAWSPNQAVRLRLRVAGAVVVEAPRSGVTHAVLPASSVGDGSCSAARAALSRARVADAEAGGCGGVAAWLVREEWLSACEHAGARVGEAAYVLREGREAA